MGSLADLKRDQANRDNPLLAFTQPLRCLGHHQMRMIEKASKRGAFVSFERQGGGGVRPCRHAVCVSLFHDHKFLFHDHKNIHSLIYCA